MILIIRAGRQDDVGAVGQGRLARRLGGAGVDVGVGLPGRAGGLAALAGPVRGAALCAARERHVVVARVARLAAGIFGRRGVSFNQSPSSIAISF